MVNGDVKIVQGVREVFEIFDAPSSNPSGSEPLQTLEGKIVLIGRDIIDLPFAKSLLTAIKTS